MSQPTLTTRPDYEFGEMLLYRTPKGSRKTLVAFVKPHDNTQAIVASKDKRKLHRVPYTGLQRARPLSAETFKLYVHPINNDPLLNVGLFIRMKRWGEKIRVASFFHKSEVRPILKAVVNTIRATGAEVDVDDRLLMEDPRG